MNNFLPKFLLAGLLLFGQIGLFSQCNVAFDFAVSSVVDNGPMGGGDCSTTITWSYDPANGNNSIVMAYNAGANKFKDNPGAQVFDGSFAYTDEVTIVVGVCGLTVDYAVFSASNGNGTACGGIEPIDNALPVEFASFEAKPMSRSNMLDWSTASEENTMLFSIEKSATGKRAWKTIGEVRAIGFSATFQNYSYEDKEPKPLNYYRIKTVDFDGYVEYSNVVVLERKDLMGLKFEAYPNPVKDQLTLDLAVDRTGPANITLSDFSGIIVLNDRIEMEEGINKIQFDTSDLEEGMYFISIHHKKDVFTTKISIIKDK